MFPMFLPPSPTQDIDKCLELFTELDQLPINAYILMHNPDIILTIKKVVGGVVVVGGVMVVGGVLWWVSEWDVVVSGWMGFVVGE